MPDYLALDALPTFHPQTLVIKTAAATSQSPLAAALADGQPLIDAVRTNGGLARLARHEHDGEVAGVYPIGGPTDTDALPRGAGALSTLATQSTEATEHAATIVQLAPSVDLTGLIRDLNDDPQVAYASTVPARYAAIPSPLVTEPFTTPSTAASSGSNSSGARLTWNLERVGLAKLSQQAVDATTGVRVGVLDTGVDDRHPALQGLVSRYVHGDAVSSVVSAQDVVGHGTHVAGVINSRYQAHLGIQGICRADLQVWKIFDDQPDYSVRAGLYWYMVDPVLYRSALADVADKVDVVNLSIGGPAQPDPQEAALFRRLIQRNICVVAAMGNERSANSPISYPAAIPGVIAVGATTPTDGIAAFSNAGDHISLCAPGASILSTLPTYPGQIGYRSTRVNGQLRPGVPFPRDVNFASQDGTSMATPHVAAAAALIIANSTRTRTSEEVNDILRITAARTAAMGSSRWTRDFGYGLLQLPRAVFAAQRL